MMRAKRAISRAARPDPSLHKSGLLGKTPKGYWFPAVASPKSSC